ncbi:Hypothetical protein NCS54_01295400 [Fusarium falciforme]|uniref:Hypothetical protein n=1 Tax=Fusarium falciforme TaxID=195108 RepID=UPI002300925A|nr:Hypothetical protein NCS54_01295400 [Fusarium falciforme]WAO95339.1 Hypothetical protein NCS54_01295400 [Fusarium falciforme]
MSTTGQESMRTSLLHPSWNGQHKAIFMPVLATAILLWLIFLGDMAYLFGTTFSQRYHTHALKVLVVDFDDGEAIPQAVQATYQMMQGSKFPTLEFQIPSPEYPNPATVKEAVCSGDYWGAMYIRSGASSDLASAVSGGPVAAGYQPHDAVTYIYNQARYSTISDNAIGANLQALVSASRSAYYKTTDGRDALVNLNRSDLNAPSSDIITFTQQGSRAFYNTLNLVFPILLTFFFFMAVNAISDANSLSLRLRRREVWLLRFVLGKSYALIAALIVTAYIWAFREDWAVADAVFVRNWLIVWFQIDINWQVFVATLGTYIPMQLASFFMLTWVIINVASTAFPFEVAPGFYRVGSAYRAIVALPILFVWWMLGHIAVVFSVRKRCANAEQTALTPTPEQPDSERSSSSSQSPVADDAMAKRE